MNISTLAPIKNLSKPSEMSPLRSPRDNDSLYKQWSYIAEIANNDNKIIQTVNQIIRELNKFESSLGQDFGFEPFQIYNSLQAFSTASVPDPAWRNVQIRGGYVFTNGINPTNDYVNGTDRMEQFAYNNILNSNPMINTYTVPTASSAYYFWVENSGSSYYVRASSTPQTPDSFYNPNGWNNWPSASVGQYWLLGWCDTSSSAANYLIRIRQVQEGDILSEVGSSQIQQFLVMSETTSSLLCYVQSGQTTVSNSYVEVLKPLELRNISHVYGNYGLQFLAQPLTSASLTSSNKRTVQIYPTASSNVQLYHQVVWPSYQSYQLTSSYSNPTNTISASIWGTLIPTADQPQGISGSIQYADLNVDGRKWMTEIAVCGGYLQLSDVTPMYSTASSINFGIL